MTLLDRILCEAKAGRQLDRLEMLDLIVADDLRGKHGDWGETAESLRRTWANRLKDTKYVLVRGVPISDLNMEHDPTGRYTPDKPSDSQMRRITAYSKVKGPMFPIFVTMSEVSVRRSLKIGRKPKLYVANGNHRVSVAITKGESKIDAYMPYKSWVLYKKVGSQ